jgi:hypothetical protein
MVAYIALLLLHAVFDLPSETISEADDRRNPCKTWIVVGDITKCLGVESVWKSRYADQLLLDFLCLWSDR